MRDRKVRTYIAAPFSWKKTVQELATALAQYGYEANMRWLEHEFPFPGGLANADNAPYARVAAGEDLEDASKAQVMIVLVHPHEGSKYGWLDERGIGLAMAEEVWSVGPRLNIFDQLDGVQVNGCDVYHFDTVADLLKHAAEEPYYE